jgi:probable addiction module antidote protein
MGMTAIAEKTGMSRTSLYKALQPNAKPQFDTVFKVLKAFGGGIEIKAAPLTE